MAGYEVGSAYLTILPSAAGFAATLGTAVTPAFLTAGRAGGATMATGVAAGGTGAFTAAGGALGKVFVGAFAAIGAANIVSSAMGWLGEAVDAASNLVETQNKVNQIFGTGARTIGSYARDGSKNILLTEQAALDAAATFGIFGQSAGLTGEDLAAFSTNLVGLASDMASFNNTTTDDAIMAIGAALRGETEPIRRYGVMMDDATLKAKAFEMGIYDGTGALEPQQRVLAAQAVIMDKTILQQGDAAKTAGEYANQQRILQRDMANVKAEIGTALLPVMKDLFVMFAEVGVPMLQDLAAWFTENKDQVREMVVGVVGGILAMVDGFLAYSVYMTSVTGFWIMLWSNLTQAFLNFVGFMIDGAVRAFGWIPEIGPKLSQAQTDFQTFRDGVDEKFTNIRAATEKGIEGFNGARDIIHDLQGSLAKLDGTHVRATVDLSINNHIITAAERALGGYYAQRATGGPVVAGRPYIVGEREAELFVPNQSGMIYNQAQIGAAAGGGGDPINYARLANEISRVKIEIGLDGRVVSQSVDQQIGGRIR